MRAFLLLLFMTSAVSLRANDNPGSIYVNLQKLHSLKRVLYVAAHPDDENTRALAWFSLGEKAETAYFSLTRGDGGQNLIGNELSEKLGVLRTQELLAARSNDGAKQYFSRAVDFGYSKSSDESFEKWGRDALLEDLVLMIRMFQPDVIVTRFPPDERAGHGHHTASAELAIEAFSKAADANIFPNQVKDYGTWQTTSIYWNAYWWRSNGSSDEAIDNPDYLIEEIGDYNSMLGMSYNEIGTIARSEHKCQGFGAIIERGSRTEYFKHLDGKKLKNSLFEENDRTWTDLSNVYLDNMIEILLQDFDFIEVEKNVPALLEIYKELQTLPTSYFKEEKLNRCREIIVDCLGLIAELLGKEYFYIAGQTVDFELQLLNRSSIPVHVDYFAPHMLKGKIISLDLEQNKKETYELKIGTTGDLGSPFWLDKPFNDVFDVAHVEGRLRAEGDASVHGTLRLIIEGTQVDLPIEASYKWRDPSYGERSRPVIGAPNFTANFEEKIMLLKPGESQEIRVKVRSFQDNLEGTITWDPMLSWEIECDERSFSIDRKGGEAWLTLNVKAIGKNALRDKLVLKDGDGNELCQYQEIAYDHIPTQTIFSPASLDFILMDAKIRSGKVAYIKGVEDAVPTAIATLGFDVEVFEVSDLADLDLSEYQSVVLGIRIYNVHPELKNYDEKLHSYVFEGGNLIMQYNTASRSGSNEFGPKPFTLSRNRVTEEDAEVTFLEPDHDILNSPNKITQEDFENWVQERGLYFAGQWDEAYTPLFSWADQGEEPVLGSLIVMEHGKGQFVYTGISFFRELPKGVVGAYRLFANLLSYKP
ncbi:PIG-L family deacetylase [Crocinitomicaceae bacterium]|nr:PIG-L family deacetylase [Crocinitomicaceae bacterium]